MVAVIDARPAGEQGPFQAAVQEMMAPLRERTMSLAIPWVVAEWPVQSLAGWVSCLADARPVGQYVETLAGAGLAVTKTESHDDALARMVEQIDARLVAFRMAKLPALADVDFDLARERTAQAARAVRDGIAGYSLLVAEKR